MSDYPQFSPFILSPFLFPMGFPGGTVLKNLPANAGGTEDAGLIPGLGRFLEEEVSNTPVFLPRESHGQRSLAGPSPFGCKELDTTEAT